MRPVYSIVQAEGFELKQRGNGFRGLCPLHDREGRNPSFVAWETGWKCWSCGESGDGPGFIMKLKGMTFPQALDYLGEERRRPTRQEKAKATKERKAKAAADWQERDLVWTLGTLIRIGHQALRALTPENFDEHCGIFENLANWERWHDVFVNGSKEDKADLKGALKDFPVYQRGRLFQPDFNYRAWAREFAQPEGKPEPQNEQPRIKIQFG